MPRRVATHVTIRAESSTAPSSESMTTGPLEDRMTLHKDQLMSAQRPASFAALLVLLLLPNGGWAQSGTSGTLAGVVKDPSGAVIPGVTVETSSPALI